jgi:aspartyl-tRNA(Asn)/glutamyl-tRNA(Gln) amidotransferase subunit B
MNDYGLSAADAALLNAERAIADTYEQVIEGQSDAGYPQLAANWILNDIMGIARSQGLRAEHLPFSTEQIRDLVDAVHSNKLTARAAKDVLGQLNEDELPSAAAERLNLLSMDDDNAVREAAQAAIDGNPAVVADYLGGKQAAIGRLIGDTMKRTGGRAKPDDVRQALLDLLKDK